MTPFPTTASGKPAGATAEAVSHNQRSASESGGEVGLLEANNEAGCNTTVKPAIKAVTECSASGNLFSPDFVNALYPRYAPCERCKTTWTNFELCKECENDLKSFRSD